MPGLSCAHRAAHRISGSVAIVTLIVAVVNILVVVWVAIISAVHASVVSGIIGVPSAIHIIIVVERTAPEVSGISKRTKSPHIVIKGAVPAKGVMPAVCRRPIVAGVVKHMGSVS